MILQQHLLQLMILQVNLVATYNFTSTLYLQLMILHENYLQLMIFSSKFTCNLSFYKKIYL